MTNNLFIGADAQIRFSLQTLRNMECRGSIKGEITELHESIFLSNDPEAAIAGEYDAKADNLVSLHMQPTRQVLPRWQALHFKMGPSVLNQAEVVGLVARSQSPSTLATRVCLRSGRDGQFLDTFFPKNMTSFFSPSTHLDAIEIDAFPDVPRNADWRELILFFHAGAVDIDLLDLRVFIV